jgi:hypothetical protein
MSGSIQTNGVKLSMNQFRVLRLTHIDFLATDPFEMPS